MLQLVYSKVEGKLTPEYLAGFIDGEGCIDVQRVYAKNGYEGRLYVRPRLRISQAVSAREVVDLMHQKFGGHMAKLREMTGRRQQAAVSLEFLSEADLTRILSMVLPHLIVKREQAKLALWWLKAAKGKRVSSYPGIDRARAIFAEELSAMKRDPQRLSERAVARIKPLMRQSELHGDVETSAEMTEAQAA